MAAVSRVRSHLRIVAWKPFIVKHITALKLNQNCTSRVYRPFYSTSATGTRTTDKSSRSKHNSATERQTSGFRSSEDGEPLNESTGIPNPGDVSLPEYIKTLEEKYASKTSVKRGWTRLTARKGIHAAFTSDSFPSQILGLTPRLLKERMDFLEGIGITGKDAMIIATDFPPVLSWDCPTFKDMLQLLVDDLGCNVVKLVSKTPYVFALNFEQAKNNIGKLVGVGLSNEVVGRLVDHNPLLLAYSFRNESLETIRCLFSHCEELGDLEIGRSQTRALELLPQLLIQPFERPGEQVEMTENSKKVVSFLKELQVPPWVIAVSNPKFFDTNIEKLYSAVEFFTNRPLFLETELLQKLLIQRSEIFVNFDILVLKRRIQLAYDILQSPTKLYMLLQTCFFFEGGDTKLEENTKMFREYGFEDKHIAQLITFKGFFSPEGSDLKEKVDFLLSVEGVTIERIAKYPLCMLKPLPFLQERLKFMMAVNPEVMKEVDFRELFATEHKEFVTQICSCDLDKYKQVMED